MVKTRSVESGHQYKDDVGNIFLKSKTQQLKDKIRSMSEIDKQHWIKDNILIEDIDVVLDAWGESTCHSEFDNILNSE